MNAPPVSADGRGLRAWHWLVLVAVCAAVYLPWLGTGGLTSTEGHRAIPGWRMLEGGGWWVPELFGQAYLRKPPGVPWAVATASVVFGETAFAARLPSALAMMAMSVLIAVVGARWFGRGGLVAGLTAALTPWFWSSGRSAEIEALCLLGTCPAVLMVIELTVNRGRGGPLWGTVAAAVLAGVGMTVAALAKGPAGFAAIGAAALVGVVMAGVGPGEGSAVARVRAGLWVAVAMVIPAVVLGWVYVNMREAAAQWTATHDRQEPITQSVTEFLWSGGLTLGGLGRALAVPPLALLAGLPGSAALAAPWWRGGAELDTRAASLSRAVALTCLLSLAAMVVLGVNNHRYAMPSLCFVPVLAAYAWARFVPSGPGAWGRAVRIAAGAALGLLAGAALWIGVLEPRQRARSGREAGVQIGALLPDGAMVWADHMVEARPEVLWYAQREAARRGSRIKVAWVPGMSRLLSLPRRGFLLLRTDSGSGEAAAYREAGLDVRLQRVWEGTVHKFTCVLYRKDSPPQTGSAPGSAAPQRAAEASHGRVFVVQEVVHGTRRQEAVDREEIHQFCGGEGEGRGVAEGVALVTPAADREHRSVGAGQ